MNFENLIVKEFTSLDKLYLIWSSRSFRICFLNLSTNWVNWIYLIQKSKNVK
jgi:hypothetical protein